MVKDKEVPFLQRFDALHTVVFDYGQPPVAEAQREILLEVLEDQDNHPTLRNDIVLVLSRDGVPRPGLGEKLIAMWRNPEESAEWRDYCLQHLETVFDLDPGNQETMRRALLEASRPERGQVAAMPPEHTPVTLAETPSLPAKQDPGTDATTPKPADIAGATPPAPPVIIDYSRRAKQVARPSAPGKGDANRSATASIIVADDQYRPEVKAALNDSPEMDRPAKTDVRDLPDSSAATALLAMERLGKRHPDFRTEAMRVARKALEQTAQQPDYAVAALQVLARGGDAIALAKARTLAMNPAYPERLRMSALWVLSAKGNSPSDLAVLRQAAADKDFRIATAGKAGLVRWGER